MKLGNYYSKEGIYKFDGRHYKPRRIANQLKISIPEVYTLCIDGYDNIKPYGWPNTILVTHNYVVNGIRPVEELRKHYDGIYAQSQLHAYAVGVAGQLPDWTIPWQQNKFMLIHEYAAGKIAWMRPDESFDNDIYMFFEDSPAPSPDEEPPQPPIPDPGLDWITFPNKWRIFGKFGFFNVDLTVEGE